jgi:hypothetical protein
MKLREAQAALLSELGRRLAPNGFRARPVAQTFTRSNKHGRHAVHLTFIDHDTDFDLTCDVAVRFDQVEDIVHSLNPLMSKADKARTYSLGAELGNIARGEPFRWTVSSSADIAKVAELVEHSLIETGFPYLETFGDPEKALAVFSRDDRNAWLHSPIHAERAKRALALLAVLRRKQEIGELGRAKVDFLTSINDPASAIVRHFVVTLSGYEPAD